MENFFVNFLLPLGRILIIVTAILMIISGIISSTNDLKGAMKGVLGMLAIAVLLFITYSISSPEHLSTTNYPSEMITKLVEGGLRTVVIMTIGTFILMLGSMIKNIFN